MNKMMREVIIGKQFQRNKSPKVNSNLKRQLKQRYPAAFVGNMF